MEWSTPSGRSNPTAHERNWSAVASAARTSFKVFEKYMLDLKLFVRFYRKYTCLPYRVAKIQGGIDIL